ncbi:MAG: GTPase [Deltaproteobacteria bacterium]|nr:GTPase [Deltaproteobacteria bacterium]
MGAGGRDFHDFLVYWKRRSRTRVVAFTAAQIPGIADRRFPAKLAGRRYPDGIPIYPEEVLPELIQRHAIDTVCLAYSDLSHQQVMEKAAVAMRAGADFLLLGPRETEVAAELPVIAITAVRTGCGKSQTARAIAQILRSRGRQPVGIRHSMPYGHDLTRQTCQRFASPRDFVRHQTTIEEEEEYQPWLDLGFPIYSGFDYRQIVRRASKEGDILIFDGGNNDHSMIQPDVQITVVDPHRSGHETTYHPGYLNLLLADVVLVNKIDSATKEDVAAVVRQIRRHNPEATIVRARSELAMTEPERIRGRRCLVIGDGPTLSHGGMSFGAGTLAVKKYGGRIVDPRPHLAGTLAKAYSRYPHLRRELPAMGYDPQQIRDLARTIERVPCDVVVDGSPANLGRILDLEVPMVRVDYELGQRSRRRLEGILEDRGLIQ